MPTERGRRPLDCGRSIRLRVVVAEAGWAVALDRSKRPPRSVARQATFWRDRASRCPTHGSLAAGSHSGAIRRPVNAIRHRGVPMPIIPRLGGTTRPLPSAERPS